MNWVTLLSILLSVCFASRYHHQTSHQEVVVGNNAVIRFINASQKDRETLVVVGETLPYTPLEKNVVEIETKRGFYAHFPVLNADLIGIRDALHWLRNDGYTNLVIVGNGPRGSAQALRTNSPEVHKLVLIDSDKSSLEVWRMPEFHAQMHRLAKSLGCVRMGDGGLYGFPTPPSVYLECIAGKREAPQVADQIGITWKPVIDRQYVFGEELSPLAINHVSLLTYKSKTGQEYDAVLVARTLEQELRVPVRQGAIQDLLSTTQTAQSIEFPLKPQLLPQVGQPECNPLTLMTMMQMMEEEREPPKVIYKIKRRKQPLMVQPLLPPPPPPAQSQEKSSIEHHYYYQPPVIMPPKPPVKKKLYYTEIKPDDYEPDYYTQPSYKQNCEQVSLQLKQMTKSVIQQQLQAIHRQFLEQMNKVQANYEYDNEDLRERLSDAEEKLQRANGELALILFQVNSEKAKAKEEHQPHHHEQEHKPQEEQKKEGKIDCEALLPLITQMQEQHKQLLESIYQLTLSVQQSQQQQQQQPTIQPPPEPLPPVQPSPPQPPPIQQQPVIVNISIPNLKAEEKIKVEAAPTEQPPINPPVNPVEPKEAESLQIQPPNPPGQNNDPSAPPLSSLVPLGSNPAAQQQFEPFPPAPNPAPQQSIGPAPQFQSSENASVSGQVHGLVNATMTFPQPNVPPTQIVQPAESLQPVPQSVPSLPLQPAVQQHQFQLPPPPPPPLPQMTLPPIPLQTEEEHGENIITSEPGKSKMVLVPSRARCKLTIHKISHEAADGLVNNNNNNQ